MPIPERAWRANHLTPRHHHGTPSFLPVTKERCWDFHHPTTHAPTFPMHSRSLGGWLWYKAAQSFTSHSKPLGQGPPLATLKKQKQQQMLDRTPLSGPNLTTPPADCVTFHSSSSSPCPVSSSVKGGGTGGPLVEGFCQYQCEQFRTGSETRERDKNVSCRPGERVWLCKHENPSSSPRTPVKVVRRDGTRLKSWC